MNEHRFLNFILVCALQILLVPSYPAEAANADKAKTTAPDKKEVVWGEMPAGARTAYIGIHGGTVPVSLLTAGDGSPMIAQVGLTGSDFLNFLRSKGKLEEELFLSDVPIPVQEGSDELPTPKLQPAPQTIQSSSAETANSSITSEGASADAGKAGSSQSQKSAETTKDSTQAASAPAPVLSSGSNPTLALAGAPGGDIPVIYATGRAFERMSLVPENWAPFGLTEKALSVEGEITILSTPKKMPRRQQKKRR